MSLGIASGVVSRSKTKDKGISNVALKQFALNLNDATTGHKLQGIPKDGMVITKFDYSQKNWVYVVLSRVR